MNISRRLTLCLAAFRLYFLVCCLSLGALASHAHAAGSGTSSDPFTILSDAYKVSSGRYYFNTGSGLFQADVDNSEGGGWVLVLQYVHQGGTDPSLSVIGAGSDLPVSSSATLGTDESAVTANWGHAGNAAMSQFPGDIELRWYGETGNHGRNIHFRSTEGDDYWRTGVGEPSGIETNFTTLTGHTANLPSAAHNLDGRTNFGDDQGEFALTYQPYYRSNTYHWNVGFGDRWEVDDFPGNESQDTIHRIWVRSVDTGTAVINKNDSGTGSLREAITFANNNTLEDNIAFNIPGTGPYTIALASALPTINDNDISIDGTTQAGASCGNLWNGTAHTLQIQIDANGGAFQGLNVAADNVALRGLSITGVGGTGSTSTGVFFDSTSDAASLTCSYIGLAPDGTADGNYYGVAIQGDNTTIGGAATTDGNVISSNGRDAVWLDENTSNVTIEGNFIGTDPTGASPSGNTRDGITNRTGSSAGITIAAIRDNLISGNDGYAFLTLSTHPVTGSSGDMIIAGNHIGVDRLGTTPLENKYGIRLNTGSISGVTIGGTSADDRNVISSNEEYGIYVRGISDVTIIGNYIGVDSTGNVEIGNDRETIEAQDVTNLTIGTSAAGNVLVGTSSVVSSVSISGATSGTVMNNRIGLGASGSTALGRPLFQISISDTSTIQIGDGTAAGANIITNSRNDGILVSGTAEVAIIGNSIYGNDDLGIDLSGGTEDSNGVTANDSGGGDADTGANDLLNFPLINTITADGTTTVGYSVELDVPANTEGYRIEFFKNSSPDTTNGEGEIFLGFVDTGDHAGGAISFDGTFTASEAVSVGDSITATATRKTATGYDITSEFAANVLAVSPLVVTNTNDSGTGSLRASIDYANLNSGADNITFQIPGTGPHTISLASALPVITDADVIIDGTSQSGTLCGNLWAGTPHTLMVRLDGADKSFDGLEVTGNSVAIKGLSMTRFEAGVRLETAAVSASVTCSYLGLAPDGTAAGNNYGALVKSTSSTIGGAGASDGNVISGNSEGGVGSGNDMVGLTIQGNFIGTDPTGTAPRANAVIGIRTLGSVDYAAITGNLISGNTDAGFQLDANDIVANPFSVTGNYIGTDRTGLTALPNGKGIFLNDYTGAAVTIGGTSAGEPNIISGNTGSGVSVNGVTGTVILGNYIGLNKDGTSDIANGEHGIVIANASNINIGNGTLAGGNVISGNTNQGIVVSGASTGLEISYNYIGVDKDGNTALSNGNDGIRLTGSGLVNASLEDNVVAAAQTTADGTGIGVIVQTGASATLLRNKIGVGANGTTALGNSNSGIAVLTGSVANIGDGTSTNGNIIAHNGADGIYLDNSTNTVSITSNSIHSNDNLGIDLFSNGVTDNDSGGGDADTGPNDLLNFPLINTITADGSTSVGYSVELDVPANTEGYRIEFFKNSSPDTTNGEGEIFLGFVDTGDHAGGAISFDGTFTASETVSVGDSISATTTRKTGATSYDITSEFAVNKTAQSSLIVTNINDSGVGSLRAAIDYANSVTTADNITFQIPGTGPHTISLASALPFITDDDVVIDGTSQSGTICGDLWAGTPHTLMIQINAKAGINGLVVDAANTTIKGLSLTNADTDLALRPSSSNAVFQCNYVGLAPDGSAAGRLNGLYIRGTGALIGGLTAGQGNVVSGNQKGINIGPASGLIIRGNFVGTDPTGLSPIANSDYGIGQSGFPTTVSDISSNLISGNTGSGIYASSMTLSGSSGDVVIAGNYIGVDRLGAAELSNGGDGITLEGANISGITIGGTSAGAGNVISGNTGVGVALSGVSDIDILGNYIGTNATGTASIPNNSHGLYLSDVSTITIGNGLASGRNVIAQAGGRPIRFVDGASTASVNGNYLGTDAAGNTSLQSGTGGGEDGIVIAKGTFSDLSITDNIIGGFGGDAIEMSGGSTTINGITIQGNTIGVGADGSTVLSTSENTNGAITARSNITITDMLIGGTGEGEGNLIAHSGSSGISIDNGAGTVSGIVTGNTIRDNVENGVTQADASSTLAIYANSIHSNGGLGINLSGGTEDANDVTANDATVGDADSGPNDLLNFPVINDFASDGNTVMTYDINLDVPSGDYRIDFYRNSAADSSGYGEGEYHLGFVELTHSGGDQQHAGSFTANSAVVQGNYIAATTTRKTGVLVYDITSEFSLTTTTGSPTELTASKTVEVYDPTSAGLYSLPGNDVISSLTVTNPGSSPADADSIVIIDAIPAEVTFYNGPIDDVGSSDPVSFVQTGGANLTFTYMTDVKYSDSGTRPTDMSGCTHTPSTGYDSSVTFICLNPKGAMAAGNPDPTFTVAYRARIK